MTDYFLKTLLAIAVLSPSGVYLIAGYNFPTFAALVSLLGMLSGAAYGWEACLEKLNNAHGDNENG